MMNISYNMLFHGMRYQIDRLIDWLMIDCFVFLHAEILSLHAIAV